MPTTTITAVNLSLSLLLPLLVSLFLCFVIIAIIATIYNSEEFSDGRWVRRILKTYISQ